MTTERLIDPDSSLAGDQYKDFGRDDLDYDPYSKESLGKGRNIISRLCGKLTPHSQRAAVISLFTSALGVALFSYPKTFSIYGYALGSIGIFYSAFCTIVSYAIVAELCGMYPSHSLYSELVIHYLGRWWSLYTSWILMIYYFGCLIGFTIVGKSDLIQPQLSSTSSSALISRLPLKSTTTSSSRDKS